MEDKETEPISGSPAKSLPLTDWKKAFPMLSRYASNKLLIRQDIVLIGLCFQRMKMIKTYYRPLLTAFPLWKKLLMNVCGHCSNKAFMTIDIYH